MKSSIRQDSFFRSGGRRALMTVALASLIGALSISPAFADHDYYDYGRDRGQRHGHHHNDWRGDRDGYYGYQPEYRRPYVYSQPVYVPPPAYYAPQQSPGISLFFPLDLRR